MMHRFPRFHALLPVIALGLIAGCGEESPTAVNGIEPRASQGVYEGIEVCHVDGGGRVSMIIVSEAAVPAHRGHGDELALVLPSGSVFSASGAYLGETPDKAFDGDRSTTWNAGDWPLQWIEVDFGSPQWFSTIAAVVNQLPDGFTNHDITLDGLSAFSWTGPTNTMGVLSHTFNSIQTAQRVRITTTASPSWVAWYEIRVLRC